MICVRVIKRYVRKFRRLISMIGGNTTVSIQTRTSTKNKIGERIAEWNTVNELTGFLDLSGENTKYTVYNAKVQESTHIFICDYRQINVKAEESRLVDEDGLVYDIMLIDDPMKLHEQLEIYLKYTGGQ